MPAPIVAFEDDFIGLNLHPAWCVSVAGSGEVALNRFVHVGGAVQLATSGTASGVARLHLGEDHHNADGSRGLLDTRNWTHRKNKKLSARVMFNVSPVDYRATIGFVGPRDPHNVCAALQQNTPPTPWYFQCIKEDVETSPITTFLPVAWTWYLFTIDTSFDAVSNVAEYARLLIDDVIYAEVTNAAALNLNEAVVEFQLWNIPNASGGWSAPAMWVDWVRVTQDR